MKCDELKPLVFSISDLSFVDEPTPQPNFQNPHDHAVYKATKVDEAIAELKTEHHKERDEYISMVHSREQTIKDLKARIADLEKLNHDLCERVTENDEIRLHWEEIEQTRAYADRDKTLQERLNEVCEKHGVSTLQDLDWAFCEAEKRHTKYCIEAVKEIYHANYKRCLAMARWCEAEVRNIRRTPLCDMDEHEGWQHDDEFWQRWHKRWLGLTEKFKEGV